MLELNIHILAVREKTHLVLCRPARIRPLGRVRTLAEVGSADVQILVALLVLQVAPLWLVAVFDLPDMIGRIGRCALRFCVYVAVVLCVGGKRKLKPGILLGITDVRPLRHWHPPRAIRNVEGLLDVSAIASPDCVHVAQAVLYL